MCSSRMTGYSETEPLPAGGERQKQNRKPGNSVCARSWVGIHAKGISDSSAHQHVGAETRAAKGGNDLESLLLEHRCGAVRRFISEGVRFPARDGIGFDETPTLLFYGFETVVRTCGTLRLALTITLGSSLALVLDSLNASVCY